MESNWNGIRIKEFGSSHNSHEIGKERDNGRDTNGANGSDKVDDTKRDSTNITYGTKLMS